MRTGSTSPASFAVHDGGLTSIEYALIAGLVALTIIGVVGDVSATLTTFFTMLSTGIAL